MRSQPKGLDEGPKLASCFDAMGVGFGSISEAHHNFLRVRCVPFAASQDMLFSVRLRGSRRPELVFQGRQSAHSGLL